jgi:hypothetical protein
VLFQTRAAQGAFWDAVKKSLDAGPKPVNLTVIRGIKASCQKRTSRTLQAAQTGGIDSIISPMLKNSNGSRKNFRNFLVISSNTQ